MSEAKLKSQIIISAVVTKSDGEIIDYGEIVNTNNDSNEIEKIKV